MAAGPKCGFAYAWDGSRCGHCHYPDSPLPDESPDDVMERRMRSKVGKHELPYGRTRVFPDVEPELVRAIKTLAGEHIHGRPVLVHVDSLSRWTMLTTREVISWHGGRLSKMSIADMVAIGSQSGPPIYASSEKIDQWKQSWEHLRVVNRQGHEAIIWVPAGGEAYAIWNILLPYVRGNA